MPRPIIVKILGVQIPSGGAPGAAILNAANVFTNVNTFSGLRLGNIIATGQDWTFQVTDFLRLADATTGSITGQLPPATGSKQIYRVKKIDSTDNVVTIAADGTDLIDDSISINLVDQWSDCVVIDAALGYWDAWVLGGTFTVEWGDIAGTLSDQTDLQLALDDKVTPSGTTTLTNKRVTPRVTTITSSATPTINTDNCDAVTITALATAITSMTSSLSGTPTNFDRLVIRIKDDGSARAITWGASFGSSQSTLPSTTVTSKVTTVGLMWDSVKALWMCMATDQEP